MRTRIRDKSTLTRKAGFSLLEMLVALILFSFVITGIYSIFNVSQNMQAASLDLSEAQQNARIALDTVERELRLAGYGISHAVQVPVLVASEYRITFVRDMNANGLVDLGETVTYFLDPSTENFVSYTTPNPRDMVLRRTVSDIHNPNASPISGYGEIVASGLTQQTDDDGTLDVPMLAYFDEQGNSLIDPAADDPYSDYYGHTVSSDAALGKPAGGTNAIGLSTIAITIICEGEAKDKFSNDYERVNLSSAVSPRNFPMHLALAKSVP